MSRRGFLEQAIRERATAAIRQIESGTAAEVVVAVRKRASRYLGSSVRGGAGVALLVFLTLLLSPTVYYWLWIGVDTLVAFALGTLLFVGVTPLRMAVTGRKTRDAAVSSAASAAFDELGIAKTKDRTGLLVYVALQERQVQVLTDVGIAEDVLSEDYTRALADMKSAVAELNEEAFIAGLLRLEQPLAQVLPRQPDDENELSDDVA